jgi:hypothetical protein
VVPDIPGRKQHEQRAQRAECVYAGDRAYSGRVAFLMFRRRHRKHPTQTSSQDGIVTPAPTPTTSDELLHLEGLDALVDAGGPEDLAALLEAPPSLNDRERAILRLRFGIDRGGIPRSLPEIGQGLGVAGQRISQIDSNALAKVRAHYTTDLA